MLYNRRKSPQGRFPIPGRFGPQETARARRVGPFKNGSWKNFVFWALKESENIFKNVHRARERYNEPTPAGCIAASLA
jgi:hypothetical protein